MNGLVVMLANSSIAMFRVPRTKAMPIINNNFTYQNDKGLIGGAIIL